jgi:dolichol kinase
MVWAVLCLDYWAAFGMLLSAFCLMLYYEYIRRRRASPGLSLDNLLRIVGNPLLRRKELRVGKWTGATCLTAAAFLVYIMFPKEIAAVALIITIVGDTFAALIGKRFGKAGKNGKSYLGSLAFAVSSLIAVLSLCSYIDRGLIFTICAIIAILPATIVERLPFDDNYSVTLTSAIFIWVSCWMFLY